MKADTVMMPLANIRPYNNNPRINDNAVDRVVASIQQFGFRQPIVVDKDMVIIVGHTRYKASKVLGLKEVPVIIADDLTPEQAKAYRLADNKVGEASLWDFDKLDEELDGILDIDMGEFGFYDDEIIEFEEPDEDGFTESGGGGRLSDVFIIPPFSILDSRQGYWVERKNLWKDLGVCNSLGRKNGLTYNISYGDGDTKTSVFDPVLCEVMYRWFCPKNGYVFDPFAGGLSRGAVAYVKGLRYLGIDLSKDQVDANNVLIKSITGNGSVQWVNDDSLNMDQYIEDGTADMVLTCPPYFDLERYSDDPKDLSNMDYDGFIGAYTEIMTKTASKLKDNRFMVVVLSDVRDSKGGYRTLCDLTRQIMADAGLMVYNELIKIDSVGTARLLAIPNFRYRKCTRTHQEVIVFYKGNPKKIQDEFGILQAEDDLLKKEGGDD